MSGNGKFQKGHTGRPLGAKARLSRIWYEAALKVCSESAAKPIDPNDDPSKIESVLRLLCAENPSGFAKIIQSSLPTDLMIETNDVTADQRERTIEFIRQQLEKEENDEADQGRAGRSAGHA